MATVVTSIGQGTTHDETAAISAVSGSGPWTVTIAANSSVNGDALFDEHATPRKYLITAGGGTTSLTVDDHEGIGSAPDNSGTSASILKRYYNGSTPLTDWEVDLEDTNVYGADVAEGRCYNDAAMDENITIDGGATPGLTSILLTVPSGERHTGIEGTGARIVSAGSGIPLTLTIALGEGLGIVEWLEIDKNGQSGVSGITLDAGASNTEHWVIRNVIIHGMLGNNQRAINGNVTAARMLNCVVYDIVSDAGGPSYGIFVTSNRDGTILNCTSHDVRHTQDASGRDAYCFAYSDRAGMTVKNCIGTDSVSEASGTNQDFLLASPTNTVTATNASSDSTAPSPIGAEPVVSSAEYVSIVAGSENLHLKTGAESIDAGTDLGTTPSGVELDIDNWNRDSDTPTRDPWDIGAHEFLPSAVEVSGASIYGNIVPIGKFSFMRPITNRRINQTQLTGVR